jgi:hypothetical protein
MPIQAKADNNVPFLPGRSRYHLLGNNPTWIYHRMTAGSALDGTAPRTATTNEELTDPKVYPGEGSWENLTKGGLFTLLAKYGHPYIVDAVDNQAGATLSIVTQAGASIRAVPGTTPFKVGAGEVLKATGGSTGGRIGFLVRLEGEKQL